MGAYCPTQFGEIHSPNFSHRRQSLFIRERRRAGHARSLFRHEKDKQQTHQGGGRPSDFANERRARHILNREDQNNEANRHDHQYRHPNDITKHFSTSISTGLPRCLTTATFLKTG